MAKVKLELETDLSQVNTVFMQAEKVIAESGVEVKQFGAEAKAAYLKAWQEANKYGKEIDDAGESVKNLGKGTKTLSAGAQRIKELRKEIKSLTGDVIILQEEGDLVGADNTIKKIGQLKDELADISDAISSVSGNARENLAKAFGTATSLVSQGFEGATAAANLLGIESKEVEKNILRLQSLQSISRIAGEFGDIGDRLKEVKLGLSPVTTGIKNFFAALRANPLQGFAIVITAVTTAVVGLIAALESLGETDEDRLNKRLDGYKELVGAIEQSYEKEIQLAQARGQRVFDLQIASNIFRFNLVESLLKDLKDLNDRSDLTEEQIEKEKELNVELREILRQRKFLIETAEIEKNNLRKELQKNYDEFAIEAIKDDESREIASAKFKVENEIEQFKQKIKLLFDEEEQVEILARDRKQRESELAKELQVIRKKYADQRLQLQKELEDALYALSQKIEAQNEEERIEKEKQAALRELAILKEGIIKKGQAINAGYKLNAEQLEQFQIIERQIYENATSELIKLEVDRQNKIAEARLTTAEANSHNLDTLQNIDIQAVGTTAKPEGLSDEQFEESKQRAILEIQKRYLAQRLELARNELNIKREIQLTELNGELAAIQNKEGEQYDFQRAAIRERLRIAEEGYDADRQLLENTFAATGQDIENQLSKLNSKKPFSLAKLLGVDQADIDALKTAVGSVMQSFSEILQLQLSKVEEEISASEKKQSTYESEIKTLEGKLEQEKKLNEKGLANNSNAIQQEIELKQNQLNKEKEVSDKATQDKKEFQKQQLLLDSVTQASNLFTASTSIFAQATASLGPYGVPVAIAAIALMLGSFVASKLKALQAINEGYFKDGVIDLQGPGTETSDSIKANLSRGESVMTAKETRENKDLFTGIHFKDKALIKKGIMKLMPGIDIPLDLSSRKDSLRSGELMAIMNNDYSSLERKISDTNEKLDKLISTSSQRIYSHNGNLIKEKGVNKVIVKK